MFGGSTPLAGTNFSVQSLTGEHVLNIGIHILGCRQCVLEPRRRGLVDFVIFAHPALKERDRQRLRILVVRDLGDVCRRRERYIHLGHA